MSLIRKFLGLQFENAVITAHRFVSPIVAGPTRQGPPQAENIVAATQTIAYLDFGDKLGVYDYASDQHRSWIRSPRVLVRGDRGEINNTRIRYLQDFSTPITDRKSTRLNSSHANISYAVFCLKKKKK